MIKRNRINKQLSDSRIYQEAQSESTSISSKIQSIVSLIRGWLGFVNAFLVEAFLVLGAVIGICLIAVLVRSGWLQ